MQTVEQANILSDEYLALLQNDAMGEAPLQGGIYVADGGIFQVKVSRESGRPHAKQHDGKAFQYAAGAVYQLQHSDKLTLRAAKMIGKAIGCCVKCGAELSDEVSVERGIGPVCEKNWFGTKRSKKKAA